MDMNSTKLITLTLPDVNSGSVKSFNGNNNSNNNSVIINEQTERNKPDICNNVDFLQTALMGLDFIYKLGCL